MASCFFCLFFELAAQRVCSLERTFMVSFFICLLFELAAQRVCWA